MGTTICGASAIAARAPVLRAKAGEIAYAVTVVFFFNMIAVFLFPALGHLFGLSDNGFGIWTGTAVNDTSAVVAAGFAFSNDAGVTATIVKLTRTTLIIPLVIGFSLALPWLDPDAPKQDVSLARRVYDSFPVFILLFLIASLITTVGLTGGHTGDIQTLGRWVMVVALAAVGLQGHWRAFAGAGARPLLLGGLTWFAVAASSLAMQALTRQFVISGGCTFSFTHDAGALAWLLPDPLSSGAKFRVSLRIRPSARGNRRRRHRKTLSLTTRGS